MLNKLNLSILLSVLLIILSVVYSSRTIDPVLMPRMTVLSLGLLVFLVLFYFKQDFDFGGVRAFLNSNQFLPFCIFLLASTISVFYANTLSEAYFGLGSTVLFLLLMLFAMSIVKNEKNAIKNAVKGIVLICLVFIFSGVQQLLKLDFSLEEKYEIRSLLGHKNLFSSALVICAFFGYYGILTFKKLWRILSIISVLGALGLIIMLQTRSALLALIVGVFSFLIISIFQRQNWNPLNSLKSKYIMWLGGLIIVFFTIVLIAHKIKPIQRLEYGKALVSESQGDYTVKERSLLWESTIFMSLDAGYFGVGAGNWKIEFPKYGSGIWRARQGMVQFQRPHNDFLWVLSETGIIGLTGYLLMFLVIIKICWTLLFRDSTSKQEKLIVKLILSMTMAYIVIASFSFPKERVIHQSLLFLSFGIVLSLFFNDFAGYGLNRNWLIIAASIAIPILYLSLKRTKGEMLSRDLMTAKSNSDWSLILSQVDEDNESYFYTLDPVSMPIAFYSGLAYLNQKNLEASKNSFLEAKKVHPNNIHVINNLAGLFQMEGDYKNSIQYYTEAIKVAPFYKTGTLNLCGVYFNSGQIFKAYETLHENRELFEDSDHAYHSYLTVVLRTLYLNLVDEQNEADRTYSANVSDSWLVERYTTSVKNKQDILEVFLIQ